MTLQGPWPAAVAIVCNVALAAAQVEEMHNTTVMSATNHPAVLCCLAAALLWPSYAASRRQPPR
jgi:hypothetical protein